MNESVTIYGKPNCEYCKKAVLYCKVKNLDYNYWSIEEADVKDELESLLGYYPKTVPQVFIGTKHIGGYSEMVVTV